MTVHYRDTSTASAHSAPVVIPQHKKNRVGTGHSARFSLYRSSGKRLLDLGVCILAAPFVVPLIAVMALFVARNGGNPFYTQDRIGRGGRVYRMWKMRSMVVNADDILEQHLASDPAARAEWNRDQKLQSDPRITPLGRLLRRSSMDELPQMWNVFCGQMSLVGPRPMMTSQKALYPGHDYYDLLPGISGNWQVSGRSKSTFADRALFDTAYNRDLSLREDLRILKDTVFVVFKGTGC